MVGVQKAQWPTVIKPHQAAAFIENLAIEKFYGVGKVTASRWRALASTKAAICSNGRRQICRSLFGKAGHYY